MKRPILILLTGHIHSSLVKTYGDFDELFSQQIRQFSSSVLPQDIQSYAICEDWPQKPLPAPENYSGIILTGSAAFLDEKQPWMLAALDFIRQAIRVETPILGVCFGHQLLASACGAQVGPNPKGRAFGTSLVTQLSQNDPLFSHLPPQFYAQVSHRDVVLSESPLFEVIGATKHDNRHMIRIGKLAWGVQFHPEWDLAISKEYMLARQKLLEENQGQDAYTHALANLKPSQEAASLLGYFVDFCYQEEDRRREPDGSSSEERL